MKKELPKAAIFSIIGVVALLAIFMVWKQLSAPLGPEPTTDQLEMNRKATEMAQQRESGVPPPGSPEGTPAMGGEQAARGGK